jgi:hypothetical protein
VVHHATPNDAPTKFLALAITPKTPVFYSSALHQDYLTDGFGSFPENWNICPSIWIAPTTGSQDFPFGSAGSRMKCTSDILSPEASDGEGIQTVKPRRTMHDSGGAGKWFKQAGNCPAAEAAILRGCQINQPERGVGCQYGR